MPTISSRTHLINLSFSCCILLYSGSLVRANPPVSINLLPSGIFSQADGLFKALDDGIVIVVGDSTPAAGKNKLANLGYGKERLQEIYQDVIGKLGIRVRSMKEFSEAPVEKEPLMMTVNVTATPGRYDGRTVWAYTVECSLSRKTVIPETNTQVQSTVWRSVPAVGVSVEDTLYDNFKAALSKNIREFVTNLAAVKSIKAKPFTESEFDSALNGKYPRQL